MTVQISGREFLDDPVAATRRELLILALSQIPTKIHEKQVDDGNSYKSMFNKRIETQLQWSTQRPKEPNKLRRLPLPQRVGVAAGGSLENTARAKTCSTSWLPISKAVMNIAKGWRRDHWNPSASSRNMGRYKNYREPRRRGFDDENYSPPIEIGKPAPGSRRLSP